MRITINHILNLTFFGVCENFSAFFLTTLASKILPQGNLGPFLEKKKLTWILLDEVPWARKCTGKGSSQKRSPRFDSATKYLEKPFSRRITLAVNVTINPAIARIEHYIECNFSAIFAQTYLIARNFFHRRWIYMIFFQLRVFLHRECKHHNNLRLKFRRWRIFSCQVSFFAIFTAHARARNSNFT